jgi:cellulose biosynthesis protein BcsQ
MTKVIAIANQKGGVGKTSTTVNLGAGLVRQGYDVLLIDLDSQANLTMALGFQNPDDMDFTISNACIFGGINMEKAKTTENGSRRKLYSVVESEQSLIDGQEQYNTLLRSRRLDLGLTMQQVAKLAGISLAQYQKFEYGKRQLSSWS